MVGRLSKSLLWLTLVFGTAAGIGYFRLYKWATTPKSISPGRGQTTQDGKMIDVTLRIPLGSLAATLESQGVISDALLFQLWVRVGSSYSRFQAGKYQFSGQVTPKEITDAMVSGATFREVVLQYTIPEGFPLRMTLERLAARNVGHIKELRRLATDPQFLREQGISATTIEGYLYPATYSFTEMPTASQALQVMVKTFWKNLPKDYEKQIKVMGLTLNQAVTFASLIELETQLDDEKTLISEVIWRRLKDNVPLGIDAAIIYGINDYRGDLRWKHLQDPSNPYNTRIHRGLPPTPIGSPGLRSLQAVLTPSNFGYYYYVLVRGSKHHHFSKTLKEHNQHVRNLVESEKAGRKDK